MSKRRPNLKALIGAIGAVTELIERTEGGGLLIGGVAVGLLVDPRYTRDVDAVIIGDPSGVPVILESAAAVGLAPESRTSPKCWNSRTDSAFYS
jgi:hypothetical protein